MADNAADRLGFRAWALLVVSLSAVFTTVRFDLREPNARGVSRADAEALLLRGDYSGAERIARELIAQLARDQTSNGTTLAGARDLLVEALLGAGKAGDPLTLALAESTLETKRRIEPSNGHSIAISLHSLGDVHFQRGEYSSALTLHQEGLDLRAHITAPAERDIADSLERLAATQMRIERYEEARRNLEKAHAIRRASEEPLELAATLELIAWLHRYAGDYAAAKVPLEEALTIRRRLTPEHPALITTIEVSGDLFMLEGDIADARATWEEALSLAERTLGSEHPLISTIERRLAYSANAIGNRSEGRRRLERALRLAERTRTQCDPELIGIIDYSASTLVIDGEYVDARKRYGTTLELTEKCFGPNNSNTATVVFNLASLAAQMGDLSEAERLYARAISAWSTRGSEDGYVAKGLDALGEVFEDSGDLARARDLYERALALRRKIRPDHPDVAWTLTNLARVLASSGDIPLALRSVTEATTILRQSGPSGEPDHLARTIGQRGDIEAQSGNYDVARADFAEALVLRERIFGSEHPLTAEARLKVARADFALGRYDQAMAGARRARESGLDHVKFTVRYLPERRALAYASRVTHGLGLELSLAITAPSVPASQFLDAVIRSRSIVLDELGSRAQVLTDSRPEVAVMLTRLNTARQRFANLMLRSMSEEVSSPEATAMLSAARREREDAEQALADQSATFQSQLARDDIGLAQVRDSLPTGGVLVSYMRYDRTLVSDAALKTQGSTRTSRPPGVVPSYLAFVLRSDQPEPSIVPLGAASDIDALVASWRHRMLDDVAGSSRAGGGESLQVLGIQIRKRIWDPLALHIKGAIRVFVVPDGTLNLLPLGALPMDNGGYLIEERPVIHYVSAERDAVRSEKPLLKSAGLLAIGGPAFSDASSFAALSGSKGGAESSAPRDGTIRGSSGCPTFQSIGFDALPGSRLEAETIAHLWDQLGTEQLSRSDHARVLTGSLATERAFKTFSPRRRILHLATHGFFLDEECVATLEGTRAVGGLTTNAKNAAAGSLPRPSPDAMENPLLLSGLALAGANRRTAATLDEDDGILTAEEVAALNLEGVEWAVLSACNTGLGTVSAGEGILGLRRAFQVAGVHTVIMSLWAVEDGAARHWMEALYRARLVDRMDTADSVRQASLTVIRERRAAGQSTQPFFWAAFVASGDWR